MGGLKKLRDDLKSYLRANYVYTGISSSLMLDNENGRTLPFYLFSQEAFIRILRLEELATNPSMQHGGLLLTIVHC